MLSAARGHLNLFFLALANEAVVVAGSYPGLSWCLWRSNKVIYILLDFIIKSQWGAFLPAAKLCQLTWSALLTLDWFC